MMKDKKSNDTVKVSLDGTNPTTDNQRPALVKSPRKIYIPIRIQTNALNNDDIAINATYISIEDLTPRVKEDKARNVEVRYLDSIRSFKDKIFSSYSCNQEHCPVIKERLDQHQLDHHSGPPRCCYRHDRQSQTKLVSPVTPRVSNGTVHQLVPIEPRLEKSVAISPAASILKRNQRLTESHSMQTQPKLTTLSDTAQGSFDTNLFRTDGQTQFSHETLNRPAQIQNETEIIPKSSIERADLNEEILKWFEDIPIYPNLSSSLKNLRQNMVNEFIDKLFELTNEPDSKEYKKKVKNEIENFLNALPMWYPGAKRDQDVLKEGKKNNLMKKINDIRERTSNETHESRFVNETVNTDDSIEERALDPEDKKKAIESEVLEWLMQIKFKQSDDLGRTLNIINATDIVTKRLMPILEKPSATKNYKLVLKGLIMDTLNDLSNVLHFPKNKRIYMNRIAEDLANKLILIQSKYKTSFNSCMSPRDRSMYRLTVCSKSSLKHSLFEGLNHCLKDFSTEHKNQIKEEITDIIIDCLDCLQFKDEIEVINKSVQNSCDISDAKGSDKNVRDILTEDIINKADCNRNLSRVCHSGTISVFTSEQEINGSSKYPVTSTPKKKSVKEVSKLNDEEVNYVNKVSCLIRAWIELLPKKFDAPEEKEFKETIIKDLAGDIMDQVKLEQLAPQTRDDREKYMKFFAYKWLLKFDVYDNVNDGTPVVEELVKKLKDIPVPDLTKPQRGNRQAMSNLKYMESDRAWKEYFVPEAIDILEDEISIFMSELPSEMYVSKDKDRENRMVHELAGTVKNCLDNKKPEIEITGELSKWLKKMVKSKQNVDKLTGELKDRILKLPQDATLAANLDQKVKRKKKALEEKAKACKKCEADESKKAVAPDVDRTLMEFIGKFMERNYDVDDSLARGAFGELLKTEFRKLCPPTRKEVYDNFSKSKQHDEFSPERLSKELQYIKTISDWLKNIPIDGSFNTPNNKKRIEFVNDLAKNVYEVEESRRTSPSAMDYDLYMASIISQSTNELPVLPEHKDNVMLMIDQLIGMIAAKRTPMPCCPNANQSAASQNNTSIQEKNLSEFIDNYIRLHASEIADDPVKMDAWSTRLLKEVKKLVGDTADPSTLCKSQVYDKLTNVAIPEEESIRKFGLELDYAKEISDWINNLPLLPITSKEGSDQRIKMVSDLAVKFAEKEKNTETTTDIEMKEYVTNWIHQLPLDKNKEIVYPIAVQQLLKRIERVTKGLEETLQPQPFTSDAINSSKRNKLKSKTKPKTSKSCRPSCCSPGGKAGRSGQVVVEAIENWSNKLPVKAVNKDAEKNIKDDVARKLYQKAGELSVDPTIMNDDLLYQELFADEVNTQLDNLKSPDVQKKKESLKNDLVDKIMEARILVKESTAGDNYKHELQNTIDASIPNPIFDRQQYDPGFEIYKNRLADMFILENFDHGNDSVKAKYEKLIEKEIDTHYQDALKRNAVPLTKEQIYSELYGALYKVPTPSEISTSTEVEEVKTRCEIDVWFGTLPLETVNDPEQLLELDKILSMLAKRLHEIERNEQKPDDKMHKEITKWILRFPLLPGEEENVDKLADDLQNRLKTSKEDRKCVSFSKDTKKVKVQKRASKTKGILGTSQVAGPSSAGRMWVSPPAPPVCCQGSATPRKRPADIILEIVENWCASLLLYASNAQDQETNRIIREDVLTKIIIKICELNSDPLTFYDDLLYNYLLDQELDKLMTKLPICCDFKPTKDAKKMELIAAIDGVKELMRDERARHEYVEELKNTVNSVLKEPLNTTAEIVALFNELRDEIVDNFVQYHYNRDNDEGKQIYKANLRDAVNKYFVNINDNPEDSPVDPLIRQNQLLCELSKISIPNKRAIKDEVEDIRMKNEIKQFFEELAFPDEDEEKMTIRNKMKLSLAKRLNEIEKTGHNCTNDAKMKKEISRCFKKLGKEVDPEKIQAFVDRLKVNEGERKASPASKEQTCYCSHPMQSHSAPGPCQCSKANQPADFNNQSSSAMAQLQIPESRDQRSSMQSLGVTPVEYQGFGGGVVFSSSHRGVGQMNRSLPTCSSRNPPTKLNHTAPTLEENQERLQQNKPEVPAPGNSQRKRRRDLDEQGIAECKCLNRIKKKMQGRPRCVLRRPDFCSECDDFGPMWMPMPYRFPPYFYY